MVIGDFYSNPKTRLEVISHPPPLEIWHYQQSSPHSFDTVESVTPTKRSASRRTFHIAFSSSPSRSGAGLGTCMPSTKSKAPRQVKTSLRSGGQTRRDASLRIRRETQRQKTAVECLWRLHPNCRGDGDEAPAFTSAACLAPHVLLEMMIDFELDFCGKCVLRFGKKVLFLVAPTPKLEAGRCGSSAVVGTLMEQLQRLGSFSNE